MVSEAKRAANEKYRREKRDQLAVDVPKGKRDAYKLMAAELGLSLSMLIQNGVEYYAWRRAGGSLPVSSKEEQTLTVADKRLVEDFNLLPDEVKPTVRKLIQQINQNSPK